MVILDQRVPLAVAWRRMKRRKLWPLAAAGLGGGAILMLLGVVTRTEIGQMLVGYGLLVILSAAYLALGLAIRDRAWRHAPALRGMRRSVDPLHGRRVF
jgi:hypothetical protein